MWPWKLAVSFLLRGPGSHIIHRTLFSIEYLEFFEGVEKILDLMHRFFLDFIQILVL